MHCLRIYKFITDIINIQYLYKQFSEKPDPQAHESDETGSSVESVNDYDHIFAA